MIKIKLENLDHAHAFKYIISNIYAEAIAYEYDIDYIEFYNLNTLFIKARKLYFGNFTTISGKRKSINFNLTPSEALLFLTLTAKERRAHYSDYTLNILNTTRDLILLQFQKLEAQQRSIVDKFRVVDQD
jgi:hypothetical protein